jgi:DNA-binding GntR family transcriptional regulator
MSENGATDSPAAAGNAKPLDAGERTYAELRRRILDGEYAPGSRLVEADLADALGVSRTPVRSALLRLQGDGFVDLIPNRGAFVAHWADVDLEEIFGLRIALESYGAALAATKIAAPQVEELKRLAEQMEAALERAEPGYLDLCANLNNEFHLLVLRATGNGRLVALMSAMVEVPLIHRTMSRFTSEQLRRSWSHHRDLITAMERRDPEWAEAAMRGHLLAARDVMREHPGGRDRPVARP